MLNLTGGRHELGILVANIDVQLPGTLQPADFGTSLLREDTGINALRHMYIRVFDERKGRMTCANM